MRARATQNAEAPAAHDRVRFDKWLWAARFYKTRSLAAQAIEAGQARLNETRAKIAHGVRIGDSVSVRKQAVAFVVDVVALSDRRGSAADAAKLYRETPASIASREEARRQRTAANDERPAGRPTKRDRRRLEDFLNEE
jgi:ribosome-associated heat shock protein Hsp15